MADLANLPTGPVSGRALARLLGLSSDNAVRSAVRSGRLRRCVLPGGGFDARLAVEEWRAATDPRQQRKVTAATDAAAASDAKRSRGKPPVKGRASRPARAAPVPAPSPAPRGTDDLQARLAAHRAARLAAAAPKGAAPDGEGEAGADGRTMADIRRDMLLVEEQAQLLDLAAKLGAVMPSEPLRVGVQTLAREMRDAVIELPASPAGGAREVAGTLTFGVDAVAGDGAGTACILHLDAAGRFTTVLGGRSYPASYIDSGTETYILHDDSLPRCRDMV